MTTSLFPFPIFSAQNLSTGAPLAGGKLFTYVATTSTPKATYTDSTGGSANTNPVILNAAGQANVWLTTGAYKMVLKDASDVIQWSVDNISPTNDALTAFETSLASGSGASLVGYNEGGTSAVNRTVTSRLQDIVTIKDFGAVGDGTTDNTTVIQAAINSLTSGTVLIPVGNFLTGALTLKDKVSLVGLGPYSRLVVKTGTGDFLTGTNLTNMIMKDFYIDCTNQTATGGSGMNINGYLKSTISGVTVYNAGSFGWLIFNAVDSKFIGNTIDTTRKWDGMTISTGSTNCVIANNEVINSYDSGIGLTATTGMSVTGNVVRRSKIAGNWFAPGIDAAGTINSTIAGNYVFGNLYGISLLQHSNTGIYPKRVTCTGNTVGDGSYGIMLGFATASPSVGTCQEITISGNQIFAQDVAGIHTDTVTSDVLISGNQITYCAGSGIQVNDSTGLKIIGNSTCNNTAYGINLGANLTDLTLWNNISENNTAGDFNYSSLSGVNVSGNRNGTGVISTNTGLVTDMTATAYHGANSSNVTVAALTTDYNIPNSGANSGLMIVRDINNGGTAIWLIDPNNGATQISSNLTSTITLNWTATTWRIRQTAGTTGRVYAFSMFVT